MFGILQKHFLLCAALSARKSAKAVFYDVIKICIIILKLFKKSCPTG